MYDSAGWKASPYIGKLHPILGDAICGDFLSQIWEIGTNPELVPIWGKYPKLDPVWDPLSLYWDQYRVTSITGNAATHLENWTDWTLYWFPI
jgi:hypothetical protein